jgi:SAM-dependent methyltransferase
MNRSAPKAALHHEVWESLGSEDPDWAVLTDPELRHGGWQDRLDDFYASGRAEVGNIFASLPSDVRLDRAIDWGSGTGRLTFALLERYSRVTAVDVSRSMLATLVSRAQKLELDARVTPTMVGDLRPASDHDLAVSLLVLQHFGTRAEVTAAVHTLVACVRVGGHLVLEIPDRPMTVRARLQPRFQVYRLLRALGVSPASLHRHGLSGISMRCLTQDLVRTTLRNSGAQVLGEPKQRSDGAHRYVRYIARRER